MYFNNTIIIIISIITITTALILVGIEKISQNFKEWGNQLRSHRFTYWILDDLVLLEQSGFEKTHKGLQSP